MGLRAQYSGVEGKERYLKEVLVEYYADTRARKGSKRRWVGVGVGYTGSNTVAAVLVLVLLTFTFATAFTETFSPLFGALCTMSGVSLGILFVYLFYVTVPEGNVRHRGWYLARRTSLSWTVERVYRSLLAHELKVEAFRAVLRSIGYNARGVIFDLPKDGTTVTVLKDALHREWTIIFVETRYATDTKMPRRVMHIVNKGIGPEHPYRAIEGPRGVERPS